MQFVKAEKAKSKLRLAISGPSGSGKTYSALRLAKGMGGRTAVIDTEQQSASLYADKFSFDRLTLDNPYSPERFMEAMAAAFNAKYDNLIIDSITHEWNGIGGCLEILNTLTRAKYKGNNYASWNEVTPRHRYFLDSMLQAPAHIIATMRSKTAYVETEKNGKKTYQKQGLEPEQRDGIEYEFTCVLDLNNDGNFATASKDRTGLFKEPCVITEATGAMLIEYLNNGKDMPDPPKVQPKDVTPIPLHKDIINDQSAMMRGCTDLASLKEVFDGCIRLARKHHDVEAEDRFISVKDGRKIELENQQTKGE